MTTLAIDTFDLGDVLDRSTAPEPEPTRAPRIARARKTGGKQPSNPDNNSLLKPAVEQTLCSGDVAEAFVIDGSTRVPRSTDRVCFLPAPDVDTDDIQRASSAETCEPVRRLYKPEVREASPMADVVTGVRRGDVDRRIRTERVLKRTERDIANDTARELREVDARAAAVQLQVEARLRKAELQRREQEQRGRLEDVPPPADTDAPIERDGDDLVAARKRELERMKREAEEFSHVQTPVTRRDGELESESLEQIVTRTMRSFEQSRTRRLATSVRKRREPGGES